MEKLKHFNHLSFSNIYKVTRCSKNVLYISFNSSIKYENPKNLSQKGFTDQIKSVFELFV